MQVNREYKDLNLSFLANPNTGDIVKLTGAEAVKRSIRNLVLYEFYEAPFQPKKGSGVTARLFENVTPLTAMQIKDDIERVIKYYEPRAKFVRVQVAENTNKADATVFVYGSPDYHYYRVDIWFEVVNLIEPVEMTVFLERVR